MPINGFAGDSPWPQSPNIQAGNSRIARGGAKSTGDAVGEHLCVADVALTANDSDGEGVCFPL